MFQETYRTMNQRITPAPALNEALLERTRRRCPALRRLAAAAVAAACLCAALPLAAATEPVYSALYALSPAVAQFFQPVQLSCTDNGVTMEVLSVSVEGSTAQAYIALTGEIVDANCDLFDSYSFHLPFDQVGHCEQTGYDETTRTATFLCTMESMDGSPISGGKMTFSVGQLLTGKKKAENLAVALELAAHSAPAAMAQDYHSVGSGEDDGVSMLLPGAPLAQPVDGIAITAAGYADEQLHVQAELGDILRTDNHCFLWLEDTAGNRLEPTEGVYFRSDSETPGSSVYEDFLFSVASTELSSYTLHGDFYTADTLTEGNWQVTFPLKNS